MIDPSAIGDDLLACLDAALETHPEPPAVTMLRTGTGEADALIGLNGAVECCSGLGIVRWAGTDPTAGPTLEPYSVATQCQPFGWAFRYELVIYRCPPTTSGRLPTSAEWGEAAAIQSEDLSALIRAVVCCFAEKEWSWTIGTSEPVGIEAQCTGVRLPVTVSVPGDQWPDCCTSA